jgi:chromosome segregation ATPase
MAETAQLGERCEIAEQAARASARALEESRSECANALVRLDEERVHHASAQSRISALETQLRDLGAKFSSARVDWSQDAERLNEAVARLKNDLSQALGRDEAHQRLLSAAQSELSALRLRSGELETQLVEARHNAAEANARAAELEAARDAHAKEAATAKRLNQSLLRRVKPMITALREKNAEGVRLTSAHAELERHFLDYQAEAGDALRNLQDRETQLVADLEVERARRVVAEGALAIDRSFRPTETSRRRSFELEGVRIPNSAADGARQIPPPEG